jgi:SAM-dependent methyltransferase
LPGWRVDGYDLDRRAEVELNALETFDTLFSGPPAETISRMVATGQQYDLIALIHVLEHIPRGHEALSSLTRLLAPGGRILVQVPNRVPNPFDLLLADHTVHFDPPSLYGVAERSGLSVEMLSEDWVVKELTLLAGHGSASEPPTEVKASAEDQVSWLSAVGKLCRDTATRGPWGIFGTSNVAAWVRQEAGVRPDFYLDEDVAKQGHHLDGIEVLAPDQVPEGAHVLMAMAPVVAKKVAARLETVKAHFIPFPPEG